ncbi:hypothetical protein [Flavivirga sp. 57AJ16]|uniref:hypothetical protein n=1 Tax=Flavivirga sp. 57AJ16 TaxID=3025307 RepID=UPI002365C135|nr:hypothetical protein [Flavivirga sp. 57AJ16]MDD7886132.1 hypothetical protein [Flavivirga sp. 57AJ16]
MEELFEKEQELISKPIVIAIENILSDGFVSNQGRLVSNVYRVNFINVHVETDESEIRNIIVITRVDFTARVRLIINDNATTDSDLTLRIGSRFNLLFDSNEKEYQIENAEDIEVVDVSY